MSSRQDRSGTGQRFILQIESLEDRTVPAGNVQVAVTDGILYVAGDDAANQIWIAGAGTNSVVIRSLDGTTTLNGQSNPLFVHGVDRGYYIRTYGGDDFLLISNTRANGTLDVDTGDGNDTLGISDAQHRKETNINLGNGDDTLAINNPVFRRAVFINSGTGNDQVAINGGGATNFVMTSPTGSGFYTTTSTLLQNAVIAGFTQGSRPTPDTTPPTATLASSAPDPTNTAPITFTATFSEAVSGFSASGVQVTNGTVSSVTQENPTTYTFQVTPTGQGAVTATVLAGAATDSAGNANLISNAISVTYDTVSPAITIDTQTTNNNTPTITGTVDDPNATVQVVINGQTLTATVNGNSWSATVNEALPDDTYPVTATATDRAGNSNSTTISTGFVVDTTKPVATITSVETNPTNSSTIHMSVVFNEAVTDFDMSDLTSAVTNGSASNLHSTDSQHYTFDITPTGDGTVSFNLAANAVRDTAGNGNALTNFSIVSDKTPPTVGIDTTPTSAGAITGTATDATTSIAHVQVSVLNTSTMMYLSNSGLFDSSTEVFLNASSTSGNTYATWTLAVSTTGTYTVHAQATDAASNLGTDSKTNIVVS